MVSSLQVFRPPSFVSLVEAGFRRSERGSPFCFLWVFVSEGEFLFIGVHAFFCYEVIKYIITMSI